MFELEWSGTLKRYYAFNGDADGLCAPAILPAIFIRDGLFDLPPRALVQKLYGWLYRAWTSPRVQRAVASVLLALVVLLARR